MTKISSGTVNLDMLLLIDKEKEQVFEDIYQFLESLDWSE